MVLCQFYLNNNCRFGSKCHNEHLDVRGTIKQEMEAAIKGRQWPLSVFGPFKEKPNLIPDEFDVSFEECRLQFLEAQASNSFPMYQQQLMQKIQDANMRMNSLLNVNKDVLQMAVNIYNADNTNGATQSNNSVGGSGSSIFGGGSAQPNNSVGGSGSSIFGGGSTTNNSNAFGSNSNAASIFGGGATSSIAKSASIFGGGQSTGFGTPQNTSNSIFGSSTASQSTFGQTSSIFGGSTSSNQNATSIFGGATNTGQQSSTSLFGQSNSNQGGSLFGQTNTFGSQPQQTSSIFSKPTAPAFGSSAFGVTPVAPTAPSGLFSSATASVFGSQSNQPPQNSSPFSLQPSNASQSVFGQTPSFGQATSTFGATSNTFGAPSQNQQQQQPTNTNIFGNLGQQATQAALASFTSQMQPPQNNVQSSPFGNQAPPPAFGSNVQVNVVQTPINDPNLYSKMEDLIPEHLAAFQAEEFILGQIPNVAPPKELC
uniref:Nucleoporin NUP42 n=1 Tax=Culicoides sonorensis TaxID=179676 RepID=A0A336KK16_CULSO